MKTIFRGNKYSNYTKKKPIDKPSYEGDIMEKIEGNKIIGKYIDKISNAGIYGDDLYIFDTDRIDRKYDKIYSCTVLDRQMKECKIGDILEIEYVKHHHDKFKDYHVYKVSKCFL